MFERSLLEAQPTRPWTTIVSITLQCSIAAAIIAVPLLHPARLVFRNTDTAKLFLPPKPAPVPPPRVTTTTSSTAAPASASAPAPGHTFNFTHPKPGLGDDPAPNLNPIGNMGTGDPSSIGIATTGTGDRPSIAVIPAKPTGPIRISTGVSTGLLLTPIKPIYPRMAVATRTEGTVIVEAIISKSGAIEAAHATSGPALLREAAIDAIRSARYSPYFLNGTPTEVQTTITVTFRLAG